MNIEILETDDIQHEDLLALRKKNSFYYHRRKAGKQITIPEMYAIYLKTRKNKRRSEDSVEFEIELEKLLTKLIENINKRIYDPTGTLKISATTQAIPIPDASMVRIFVISSPAKRR